MKIKYRKPATLVALLSLCVIVILVIILAIFHSQSGQNASKPYYSWAATVSIDPTKLYQVSDVVDGDTIKVYIDGHNITIRLLGINSPETVKPNWPVECYGPEASTEMKSLLTGKSVLLALNPDYDRTDKYGRLLAYIWLKDNSKMFVNEYMVKQGYAHEYTFDERKPYQYQAQFRADEAEAKASKNGLWGKCE